MREKELLESLRSLRTGSAPEDLSRCLKALSDQAASSDPAARDRANTLLFRDLIEPLGDAFDPALAELYENVFSEIIDHERHRPGSEELDRTLARFGLGNAEALRVRRQRLRADGHPAPGPLDRVVVLSRVTIGADVAVTSVILGEIRRTHPEAEVVLIGPPRVGELFAGDAGIRLVEAPYPRRGTLADRLRQWPTLAAIVQELKRETGADRFLIVDPDSRLTQLGLLPLTDQDADLRIFESRSAGAGTDTCLGRLSARWARKVFGTEDAPEGLPHLRLAPSVRDRARTRIASFRLPSHRRTIAVSFGVGGNPAKRVDRAFELGVVLGLLEEGHGVVLDRGVDTDREASREILAALGAHGKTVVEFREEDMARAPGKADVLAWDGGVGMFAGMIENCDLYLGYDSAFQHIAAALGIPVLAIVEGAPNPRFRARWTPWSERPVRVLSGGASVSRTLGEARRLLAGISPP